MKKIDRQNPHFLKFRYINVHFWPRESIRRGRNTPLARSLNFFDYLKNSFWQFSTFWPTFDLQNRRFFSSIAILEAFRTIFHLPCHRSLSLCYTSTFGCPIHYKGPSFWRTLKHTNRRKRSESAIISPKTSTPNVHTTWKSWVCELEQYNQSDTGGTSSRVRKSLR